ncbi:hypothetical protein ABBQ38_010538 [Trebouxia sp. C0009 RCD-2024]
MAAEFDKFVRQTLGHAKGLAGFHPESKHASAMCAFGDMHPVDECSSVLALHQGPGDIVQVPPGWPHAVNNLMYCCKLAWDYIDMGQLANYMAVQRDIVSPLFTGEGIANDYMAVAPVLSAAIAKACRQLR